MVVAKKLTPLQVEDTRTGQVTYWEIPKHGVRGDQLETELAKAGVTAAPYLVDPGAGYVLCLGRQGAIDTAKASEVIAAHKPDKKPKD